MRIIHWSPWFAILGYSFAAVASPIPTSEPISNLEQSQQLAQNSDALSNPVPRDPIPAPPLPETPLSPLPPPEELLPLPETPPPPSPNLDIPETIFIQRFEIVGNTAFSSEELLAELKKQGLVGRELSFAELIQARSVITQYYVARGYVTSGALIPPQAIRDGVAQIQVIEGSLETINVEGNRRLNPGYIRSRLAIAGSTPLNINRLLEGLQLLQINPLIESISAELQSGIRPGSSVLQVQVAEADSFNTTVSLNNNRAPSVGSFQRRVQLAEGNLLGLGDSIGLQYSNTDGSNEINGTYSLPINPRNGTVQFAFGTSWNRVIEPPFDELEIESNSRYYELTLRQPLYQSPNEELVIGLTASRQESQTELGINDIGRYRLLPGADQQGRTRISALRLSQEWTERSSWHVFAARSQFNLGLDLLDATINENAPDSRFLSWRGQAQWVRLVARDTLLLIRGNVQLSDSPLVPVEQFGLGGQETVRGYRQDTLLTDNGALLSAEVRVPIVRVPELQGVLQVVPFVDVGTGWNSEGTDPDPNTLVGAGLGLAWQQGDNLSIRVDWGIPIVSVESGDRTLQENGLYFSVVYTPL